MTRYDVSASATVPAPGPLVYRVLADYHRHHPHILPRRWFQRIEVEAGGVGDGTRIRVVMRLLGTVKELRMTVVELERGRVLAEVDRDGASVTTFTVDPEVRGCRVTVHTVLAATRGLRGAIERVVLAATLRRIYREELRLLAWYAAELARLALPDLGMDGLVGARR